MAEQPWGKAFRYLFVIYQSQYHTFVLGLDDLFNPYIRSFAYMQSDFPRCFVYSLQSLKHAALHISVNSLLCVYFISCQKGRGVQRENFLNIFLGFFKQSLFI